MDIWTQLTQAHGEQPGGDDPGEAEAGAGAAPVASVPKAGESFCLVAGMSGSGKSSLISAYLNPSKEEREAPKPTAALEYQFARKSSTSSSSSSVLKDVTHIWELGGGHHTSNLVSVPITSQNFQDACYVVVLDLSRPSNLVPSLLYWADKIKGAVRACVREVSKADPSFADGLKRKTYAKFGKNHPDLHSVKPCPVPLVIVANKYDIFKDFESARRKVVCQALRFIAHLNGATLIYCSSKEKQLRDVLRTTLNTYLFRSAARKVMETHPEKALLVPAGGDSFEAILKSTPGSTKSTDFVTGSAVQEGAMAKWRAEIESHFGPPGQGEGISDKSASEGKEDEEDVAGPDPADEYPEPSVDEARALRNQALEQYRKEADRRAKIERRAAASQPSSGARIRKGSSSKPLVASSSSTSSQGRK